MNDTISRKAAIDEFEKELSGKYNYNMRERAIGFVGVKSILEKLPPAQQWIPCSERLPEDDVEVLITDDSGGVQWLGIDSMMSYEDGSGRFWISSQNPTAWMPLPEPYVERGRLNE